MLYKTFICYAICCICTVQLYAYTVRPTREADLPELLALDREISLEYFVPLYQQGYSHLPLGQNPEYFLELDLAYDQQWFPEIINNNSDSAIMLVGYDDENDRLMGFIIIHKDTESSVLIDLLLIAKEYRGLKLGKTLISQALNYFPDIDYCRVTPIRFANEATLKFYESVGFVNMGPSTIDGLCIYGIPYNQMYWNYQLNLNSKRSARLPIRYKNYFCNNHHSVRSGI